MTVCHDDWMWIETDSYIGPCRRGGGSKFRLLNRRRLMGGDRDPSLQTLLRQLHSNAMDLTDETKRRRFKLLLAATIGVADRGRLAACAQKLTQLDAAMTDHALQAPGAATVIETFLEAAAAQAR